MRSIAKDPSSVKMKLVKENLVPYFYNDFGISEQRSNI